MEDDVSSCALHKPSHVLIVGFKHGLFVLYEVPEFNKIHSLRYASNLLKQDIIL